MKCPTCNSEVLYHRVGNSLQLFNRHGDVRAAVLGDRLNEDRIEKIVDVTRIAVHLCSPEPDLESLPADDQRVIDSFWESITEHAYSRFCPRPGCEAKAGERCRDMRHKRESRVEARWPHQERWNEFVRSTPRLLEVAQVNGILS